MCMCIIHMYTGMFNITLFTSFYIQIKLFCRFNYHMICKVWCSKNLIVLCLTYLSSVGLACLLLIKKYLQIVLLPIFELLNIVFFLYMAWYIRCLKNHTSPRLKPKPRFIEIWNASALNIIWWVVSTWLYMSLIKGEHHIFNK